MPEPLSVPILRVPRRSEPQPRRGSVDLSTGYRPEKLNESLEAAFKRLSSEPVPETEPVAITLDGTEYEGEQVRAGDVRVAAAWVAGRRLLVVSVVGWDGPLVLDMVTPEGMSAEQA